ncbi:hypothetical protein CGRA01v4_11827 [Colletotrichum graminicola]|nr:hypothetical protein CGRA01v4_11827 [Colletotrichum graminicola]
MSWVLIQPPATSRTLPWELPRCATIKSLRWAVCAKFGHLGK